jgi:hypothetical protein
MLMTEILFALLVAGILTAVFAGGFRRRGPWASGIWFFVVVLLAAWVGGVWARPVGPPIWGLYWVPFLWIGLLFALLLAAASPTPPPRRLQEPGGQPPGEVSAAAPTSVAVGWFLWALLIGLALGLVFYYVPVAK